MKTKEEQQELSEQSEKIEKEVVEIIEVVEKPKSKTTLFWEKYHGIRGEILDMRAVLK